MAEEFSVFYGVLVFFYHSWAVSIHLRVKLVSVGFTLIALSMLSTDPTLDQKSTGRRLSEGEARLFSFSFLLKDNPRACYQLAEISFLYMQVGKHQEKVKKLYVFLL